MKRNMNRISSNASYAGTIPWETLETRIALDMDSDTEMDDEIFFYCDTLDSLLSLADKAGKILS